jgi:hypothetical protein
MSWAIHQRFDGLNTTEQHRIPQIAISFVKASDELELFDCGDDRYRVDIAVECPDDEILGIMRTRMKNGSKV